MRIPIYHVTKVPSPFIKRRFFDFFFQIREGKKALKFFSPCHPSHFLFRF